MTAETIVILVLQKILIIQLRDLFYIKGYTLQ